MFYTLMFCLLCTIVSMITLIYIMTRCDTFWEFVATGLSLLIILACIPAYLKEIFSWALMDAVVVALIGLFTIPIFAAIHRKLR